MKAMILAAGMGTRLGPITREIPKALVEINGKSVLRLAVEKCYGSGFREIIVNVHHFAGMVISEIEKLRSMGFSIEVSDERGQLLDTGGGLYRARDFFDSSPFLLYNTDIISDLDLSGLYELHKSLGGIATLAVRKREGNRFFLVNGSGLIQGWCNNATGERIVSDNSDPGLIQAGFLGVHLLDPEIFDFMSGGVYSMTSVYLSLINLRKIYAMWHNKGYWFDIGTSQKLEEARLFLRNAGLQSGY